MTKGEYLDLICKGVKEYREKGVNASIKRNSHMHAYRGADLSKDAIDAILVGVLNHLGMKQGIDLAFYAVDFDN